jgi:hypothetical protein
MLKVITHLGGGGGVTVTRHHFGKKNIRLRS